MHSFNRGDDMTGVIAAIRSVPGVVVIDLGTGFPNTLRMIPGANVLENA